MTYVPDKVRKQVILRAGNLCEYCHLAQDGQEAIFHIDHVHPVHLGGETTLENLALACVSCSLRKGGKNEITDPESQERVPIFNPRQQTWADHFSWKHVVVQGKTPNGRALVAALRMNRPVILEIRRQEISLGRQLSP